MKKVIALILLMNSALNYLEAAVHQVTNTNDNGAGSLRQAIIDTNMDKDPTRTIIFSIDSGIQIIRPLTDMPEITADNVTLTGTTQPGWNINNPVIVIDGSLWSSPKTAKGLITISGANNCVISGLVINNASKAHQNGILITHNEVVGSNNNAVYGCFIGTDQSGTKAAPNVNGIQITSSTNILSEGNIIGGAKEEERNVISGNDNGGIELLINVNKTIIRGNYIGSDKTGTISIPNKSFGIGIFGSLTPLETENCVGTIIGGSSEGEGNVISGNVSGDVYNGSVGIVFLFNCIDTIIKGNHIGVDKGGTVSLPNDIGILLIGDHPETATSTGAINGTIIGGSNPQDSNIISANNQQGIYLQFNVKNTQILGNYIGTDKSQLLDMGNGCSGINIEGELNAICKNNIIGGLTSKERNIIAFNGFSDPYDKFGIYINGDSTTPNILNPILGNSIYNNANNGIELQNKGNNTQEYPNIIKAEFSPVGNMVVVTVTAPSNPENATFRLEFFVNYYNRNPIREGKIFVGAIPTISSGATITQAFTIPCDVITSGCYISSTATNLNNKDNSAGDTSEFTDNVKLMPLTSIIG